MSNNFNVINSSLSLSQIASPLDQFEIRNYIGIDAPILFNSSISLTNIGLYIIISGIIIVLFHILTTNNNKVI